MGLSINHYKTIIDQQDEPINFFSFISITKSAFLQDVSSGTWQDLDKEIKFCEFLMKRFKVYEGSLSFSISDNKYIEEFLSFSQSSNRITIPAKLFYEILNKGVTEFIRLIQKCQLENDDNLLNWLKEKVKSIFDIYKFLGDFKENNKEDTLENYIVIIEHIKDLSTPY